MEHELPDDNGVDEGGGDMDFAGSLGIDLRRQVHSVADGSRYGLPVNIVDPEMYLMEMECMMFAGCVADRPVIFAG